MDVLRDSLVVFVAPGFTTSNKKPLVTRCIATRNKKLDITFIYGGVSSVQSPLRSDSLEPRSIRQTSYLLLAVATVHEKAISASSPEQRVGLAQNSMTSLGPNMNRIWKH